MAAKLNVGISDLRKQRQIIFNKVEILLSVNDSVVLSEEERAHLYAVCDFFGEIIDAYEDHEDEVTLILER